MKAKSIEPIFDFRVSGSRLNTKSMKKSIKEVLAYLMDVPEVKIEEIMNSLETMYYPNVFYKDKIVLANNNRILTRNYIIEVDLPTEVDTSYRVIFHPKNRTVFALSPANYNYLSTMIFQKGIIRGEINKAIANLDMDSVLLSEKDIKSVINKYIKSNQLEQNKKEILTDIDKAKKLFSAGKTFRFGTKSIYTSDLIISRYSIHTDDIKRDVLISLKHYPLNKLLTMDDITMDDIKYWRRSLVNLLEDKIIDIIERQNKIRVKFGRFDLRFDFESGKKKYTVNGHIIKKSNIKQIFRLLRDGYSVVNQHGLDKYIQHMDYLGTRQIEDLLGSPYTIKFKSRNKQEIIPFSVNYNKTSDMWSIDFIGEHYILPYHSKEDGSIRTLIKAAQTNGLSEPELLMIMNIAFDRDIKDIKDQIDKYIMASRF